MKKKLILILTLILLLLILNNKSLLEGSIKNRLSNITEHKVELELIKLNLFSGAIEFKEIKIENKKNFFNKNIFEAEKIIIKLDPSTYFSNLVIIEQFNLYKPKFFFEIKNFDKKNEKKDNLEILEKLTSKTKPKVYPKKNKDKNFLISRLEIKNAVAYIKHKSNKANFKLPSYYNKYTMDPGCEVPYNNTRRRGCRAISRGSTFTRTSIIRRSTCRNN